jgi:hypothetical protein
MKHKPSCRDPVFVEYDDGNLEHVLAGPDYGQPDSSSAWNEIDSKEYPEYVSTLSSQILKNAVIKKLLG